MKSNKCDKCEIKPTTDKKMDICEKCKKERRKKIIIISSVAFVVVAGVVVTTIYLKKHPKAFENFKGLCKDKIVHLGTKGKRNSFFLGKSPKDIAVTAETEPALNFLTTVDQQKIDLALKRKLISNRFVEKSKVAWEQGLMNVDESLGVLEGGKDILGAFSDWKEKVKNISPKEFDFIISNAAKITQKVKDAKVVGNLVELTVESNSGKTTWTAVLDFYDSEGTLSIDCNYGAAYGTGNVPKFFADNVRKLMKYVVETKVD